MRDFFINPPKAHENFYDIVGLPYDFDFSNRGEVAALHRAYNELALYHHPATPSNAERQNEAKNIFRLLNVAFKTLMNTKQRATYNITHGILAEIKPTIEIEATSATAAASAPPALPEEAPVTLEPITLNIDPIDHPKFADAMNFRHPKPQKSFMGLFTSQAKVPDAPNIGEARQMLPKIVKSIDEQTVLEDVLLQYFLLFNTIKSLEGKPELAAVFNLLKESFGATRYEVISQLKAKKLEQDSDLTLSMFSAIFPHVRHNNNHPYDQYFVPAILAFINADLLDAGIINAHYKKSGETLAFCDMLNAIKQIADIQHNVPLRLECKNFFYVRPHMAATLASGGITSYPAKATKETITCYLIAILKAPLSAHIIKSILNDPLLKTNISNLDVKLSELPQRAIFIHIAQKGVDPRKTELVLPFAQELMLMRDTEEMYNKTIAFLGQHGNKNTKSLIEDILPGLLEAAYRDTNDTFVNRLTAPAAGMRP